MVWQNGIEKRVVEVLRVAFDVRAEQLLPQVRLVDELYADSMELLDMVLRLNDAFKIQISAVDVSRMQTVEDVCAVVLKCLAADGKQLV